LAGEEVGEGEGKERDLHLLALGALLAALLGEEGVVDVGEDTTLGDGDAVEKLVELIVVADSKLDVAGVDAVLLVVVGGVTGKLDNLGGEVLEDGSEVDGGTSTDAGSVVAVAEVTVDTTDREAEPSAGRAGLALALGGLSGLSTTSHC
jgi:hypothetical protein